MKSITKLSLVAAALAVISTTAAFADNQQMQNQLALQRAQSAEAGRTTTVAAYANDRGVGRRTQQAARTETRFELRSNAHGENFPAYVPAQK